MEARRASSPARRPLCKYRLLLRVYAAESLRHVASQGTFVKVAIEEGESAVSHRGSARASLKRLLHGSARAHEPHSPEAGDPLDPLLRRAQTRVQKSLHGKPVWNEKFELPVLDPASDVLHLRVKSARLLAAPAVGAAALPLRELARDETADKWVNLFDSSRKPAGRLRIQVRLAPAASMSASMIVASSSAEADEERDTYYQHPRRTTSARSAPSPTPSPLPRSNRRGAIIAPPIGGVGAFRRSSTLSRSLLEARTSGSTTASDSISSDYSQPGDAMTSVGSVAPYTPDPVATKAPSPLPITHVVSRDTDASSTVSGPRYTALSRATALSVSSRDTEELDFLASKYMNKPARTATASSARKSSLPVHETPVPPPAPLVSPIRGPEQEERRSSVLAQCVIGSPTSSSKHETAMFEDDEEEQPVSASSSAAGSPPLSDIRARTGSAATSVCGSLVAPAATKSPKDTRTSPRTTNTTAASSDEDEPGEATIEFDFDTGDVRPSTRLPSHMMRSTVTRSSIATSRIDESDDESSSESDDEQEDDEMDPDGDPDGPRMVLRATVTRLLRRDSVNVIMDVDEEDEDDDDFELDPFVFDELPILDMSDTLLFVKDIDCMDQPAAAS